ncbi:MAG TPA: alkaline phosphatase family protein [Blastococcus sp.]|jgi:acid phosphatase|nr:alkaline phosphatase family protein [Blastococcus sp.]
MTRFRGAVGLLVLALTVAGCSSGGEGGGSAQATSSSSSGTSAAFARPTTVPPSSAAGVLPRPDHVMVVIFENKDSGSVLGSSDAPYLNSLATSGATLTDAHGVAHPSQPNYLALFSGSTQGVTDDSCPQSFDGPNLAAQLLAAGRTFAGYSENLPGVGSTVCGGATTYARKHNPWVDFPALPASVNQPYTALPHDFAQLPTVSFVVPNLCHDMHNCSVATGDAWAKANLAAYVSWARTHNSLLVVTFDEDEDTSANHIATFLVGPMVKPGPSAQRTDHYGVLRTLEDMYGLAPIGSAAGAKPLTGIWTR